MTEKGVSGVITKLVSTADDIKGMKLLQEQNLRPNLSPEEIASEGFVTNTYSIDFFSMMHNACPSIIAVDISKGNSVVGYALAATKEVAFNHEFMRGFKLHIDHIPYHGDPLGDSNYIMVGQVCIAKGYRGCGIFPAMYTEYRQQWSSTFKYCITDVSMDNPRSLKAHLKIGFEVLEKRTVEGETWYTIIWDWNAPSIGAVETALSTPSPQPPAAEELRLQHPAEHPPPNVPSPNLIIVRGPSASGKSTLSRRLLESWKSIGEREVVYVEQDYIRNDMLKYVKDPRKASVDMIHACVSAALNANCDVLLEGILNTRHYGSMLQRLTDSLPVKNVFVFYLDVPLEETKYRHALRDKIHVFGVDKLDAWYGSAQPWGHPNEVVLSSHLLIDDMQRVVTDAMTGVVLV
jgi:adenylylsulfate kinase-like enzyme